MAEGGVVVARVEVHPAGFVAAFADVVVTFGFLGGVHSFDTVTEGSIDPTLDPIGALHDPRTDPS